MTEDWRACKLGDLIELKRGYDLPSSERRRGPVPIVSSSGISGWHNEAKVRGPGVVTGRYGTIGQVFFIDEDFWPLNTTLYVRDFKGHNERFISYFLRSLDFQAFNDKSSVPGLNRNDVHRYEVILPEEAAEECAIAGVLGALDDKIEQNRRTAQVLEQMARAIFRAWFVDFEPVKAKAEGSTAFPSMPQPVFDALPTRFVDSEIGPLPEGWEVKALDKVADFLNGLALQKYPPRGVGTDLPIIKIAQLRKGSTQGADAANDSIDEKYKIQNGDLLFSWSGTLEVVFWFGGHAALNQHLFKVTSNDYPQWLVYEWIQQHLPEFRLIAASKATTMGHIKRGHLSQAMVAVPPPAFLEQSNQALAPLFDIIATSQLESCKLAEVRDYLLPKLLSGNIRVHNVIHEHEVDTP